MMYDGNECATVTSMDLEDSTNYVIVKFEMIEINVLDVNVSNFHIISTQRNLPQTLSKWELSIY